MPIPLGFVGKKRKSLFLPHIFPTRTWWCISPPWTYGTQKSCAVYELRSEMPISLDFVGYSTRFLGKKRKSLFSPHIFPTRTWWHISPLLTDGTQKSCAVYELRPKCRFRLILWAIAHGFWAKIASYYFLFKFSPLVYHDNKALPRKFRLPDVSLAKCWRPASPSIPATKGLEFPKALALVG